MYDIFSVCHKFEVKQRISRSSWFSVIEWNTGGTIVKPVIVWGSLFLEAIIAAIICSRVVAAQRFITLKLTIAFFTQLAADRSEFESGWSKSLLGIHIFRLCIQTTYILCSQENKFMLCFELNKDYIY